MRKIRSVHETVLKKQPIQSSLLPDKDLHHVDVGKVYAYSKILKEQSGHVQLELAYGAGTWWIFVPHWDGLDLIANNDPNPSEPNITIITKEYTAPVQRQIDRLKTYNPNPNLNTKTTYFSQRDNSKMPHRTCNTSANAMYLRWLQEATGKTPIKSDEDYLPHVFKYGDTIYHGVQTRALRDFGFHTQWMTDRDFPFIKDLLEAGFPVVCNILHRGSLTRPTGGHIIMLIAYDRAKRVFTAHDPYGTLNSNYSVHNGAYSTITEKVFTIRSQGGYRTLAKKP